ncbi:bifunctional tetrahydrofolate synthase/dihydrofolate synthase [Shewanella sedimentimangrovi]|uniref:Dihydrofolate synthase/folylpolyglutamate synthase n=1 Tax=Shewanella sedimentimangrovi TaxID=2814293 RepID=A0ABX7QYC2_9GAMM|nr:bifunctional tetrahydrofolate synthase/dihydrofolate synthase [Shewanella sedimentimangrovi]QSX35936.1 bifunctional tetrahydrofolate synthase/dihydrofolate synthase [Shewanella sedimentimangrovi]
MEKRPGRDSNLQQWLDYQLSIHPTEIEMGLGRVTAVARRLGVDSLPDSLVITVAGTNGKGSTCAMLESVLAGAGYSVGVYSSPHMLKYNERVRIGGKDAADADLIAAFDAIETARGEISLTFFEYATLAGLMLFAAAKPDVVILEVGLGGRLDATNLINADVAVITAVDLDHQAFLGNTREAVGREKAGIFREDKAAVVGEADLPHTVIEVAAEKGARLYRVGQEFSYGDDGTLWHFQGRQRSLQNLPLPQLPLPNAATVIAVLEQLPLNISDEQIARGIAAARLTGRMEQIASAPDIILDVAHNPHAARFLVKQLAAYDGKRIRALCGMLKDKDIAGVMQIMTPVISDWYLVSLGGERGASADTLRDCLPASASVRCFAGMDEARDAVLAEAGKDEVVIVFGSFYTVSGFKSLMGGN